ncbi:MAG TPA: histidinol dehydrogenase, partial [Opitutales bacterium]|nr:histidinol dehydrogenase [Opitutales bacterium]
VFMGPWTPESVGDFAAGPNHTLPTLRTGRFYSGLQTTDFLRRSSVTRYDENSLPKAADIVRTFARLEQLDGHGECLEIRLKK